MSLKFEVFETVCLLISVLLSNYLVQYKANPNDTIESSTTISAISPLATMSIALASTTTPTTILATTSATTLATFLATPSTTTSITSLVAIEQQVQIREIDRVQHQYHRAANTTQQIKKSKNIARCSLDNFNLELEYALKWKNETLGFCCHNVKIQLALLEPLSPAILELLTGSDINTGKRYIQNIRSYNSAFAFTSLGLPRFSQIYFYDSDFDTQFELRNQISPNLNLNLMRSLQIELNYINPFVQIFQNAGQQTQINSNLRLKIFSIHSYDMRNYNQATASKIAVIINDNYLINSGRDIILTSVPMNLN
ncbi:hypothetical protein C2G38_2191900 [Gigaspora rosea]|uniref:Uncharacterized protein n=1 Tax=Gigaspora rosea TaxID=44941 RepID=A0A397UZT9_9GLOM|nr:hypothetical protein C2G38_2191900 [Gigaspora rosea]